MKKAVEFRNIRFKYAKGKTDICSSMLHDCYEIYYFINGDVEYINKAIRKKINPGQIVVIPPGEYHQFSVINNIENYERCVIDIYPEFLDKSVVETALSDKDILSPEKNDRLINNFLYLKECILKLSKEDFSFILPAVATDIVFLIKNYSGIKQLPDNPDTLSAKLMDYIDKHYRENIVLQKMSDSFHFSVSSLCHTFKRDFGISIKKYIIQKRMTASFLALQNGGKPEEVCSMYGFSNYSTFYRAYIKYFGISPSETRLRK